MRLLNYPLVLALGAMLLGLLPALRFSLPPFPFLLATFLALGAAAFFERRRSPACGSPGRAADVALLGAFALAGVTLGAAAHRAVEADCRAWLPDGAQLTLRGALAASAFPVSGDSAASLVLPVVVGSAVGTAGQISGCKGEMRVRFPAPAAPVLAGSVMWLEGRWVRFSDPVSRSAWPRMPRTRGLFEVSEIAHIEAPGLTVHPLLTLRGGAELHVQKLFPRHASLVEALFLGRRETLDPALRDRFARAGLAHLLAISGMHVGLLTGMLLLVGTRIRRVPRSRVLGATVAAVAFYLLLIGAPPSAMCAGVMISAALLGLALQRSSAPATLVSCAAILILLFDPTAILQPGFQLSFAGVLGILVARGTALHHLQGAWRHRSAVAWVVEGVTISTAAFLATAPVAAWHFGLVAPVAVVANLVTVPLLSVAMAGIVIAALLGLLSLPLGRVFADGAGVLLDVLARVAEAAAAIPWGHASVPRPDVAVWAAAAVTLLLGLDAFGHLRPKVRWVSAALAVGVVVLAWPSLAAVPARTAALELHFLDVGQGDALAIQTPADRWLLVDAGPRTERSDAGERRVVPFLRARGVRRLEAAIFTHPDADHVGGGAAVLRNLDVGQLIDPGLPAGKPAYLEMLREAEKQELPWIPARSGRTIRIDGVTLDILWPDESALDAARDANEISVVIHVRFNDFALLLTGDAPAEVERTLVERYGSTLRSSVLKAGHHGSNTSSSSDLLNAVQPELVIVSAGKNNRYGHPAPEVLARLAERGITVLRTDRQGTISLRATGTAPDRWALVER